jgi:3',5'-cyclic AMP phosphodiesterase CpdA
VLPSNAGSGFTVVTRNPLYVVGHYNCPNDAHLGTTNTSSAVSAALMSDALTFLSTNWNDALGSGSYTARDATDMTVNAAILTGNVPSTGTSTSTFSGGAAKLFRLLEDWLNTPGGWRTLTLNTSFVCLFSSNQATNQMRLAGNFGLPNNPYYDPPIRQYSFDARFRNLYTIPPGTPSVSVADP